MSARDLKFGFFLPQWRRSIMSDVLRSGQVISFAQFAERVGFDALWLADHFCYELYVDMLAHGIQLSDDLRGVKTGAWECWTTLAALAIATERVTIGTLVTNTGYRNPALLAHMANTVDDLSDGRLVLGLGAGDYPSEHQMHGYPWDRHVGRFEEALQIIRPMLHGEVVTFAGEFYETHEAEIMLKGPRNTGPPVMIGLLHGGPRMKRLVVEYADIWDCWMVSWDSRPEAYIEQRDAMYAACERHERDPATLRQHVSVAIVLPGHEQEGSGKPLIGSEAKIAEQIAIFADHGVSQITFVATPQTRESVEWLARVIEQVRA